MEQEIKIKVDTVELNGNLIVPEGAKGIVLFAHGSGSSRLSPRNKLVAKILQGHRLSTLLIDLLTEEEEIVDKQTMELRFDINLLAKRLMGITKWLKNDSRTKKLKIGYFGSSTGAAAALISAAKLPMEIKAVVSRGGRPDLAIKFLPKVNAPTLLIVGGSDEPVIELNKEALNKLRCEKKLEMIPSATHLFEESGKLNQVAKLATEWFNKYLR